MNRWFDYTLASDGGLGELRAAVMEYVLAGNGVFIRARRAGLEVLIPAAECEVRGLPMLEPYVELEYPKIRGEALAALIYESRDVCAQAGGLTEALFHIWWDEGWRVEMPPQEASASHVRPTHTGIGSTHGRAVVEIHSHHRMRARFSPTDDSDESSGFRIYGVLGRIFDAPELTLRVGCHGYFYEFPADRLFEGADAFAGPASTEAR